MGPFETVRLSALPPVRRAVPLRKGSPSGRLEMERFFQNRRITLYGSGTAALAQAIASCAARSSASAPEVILPAYGCPNLVAACIHASVYPRLVDVAPSRWSYDLESLRSAISNNTAAVVAVNLLGIGDGITELTSICKERRISLIQDSAQYLPREISDWPGDYVVLSFGRGKPLNLLHGGALVSRAGDLENPSIPPGQCTARDRLLSSRAAAIAFNTLTLPYIYRIFSALPGTGLGEVIYSPLVNAAPVPEVAWRRLGVAFERYRQDPSYRRSIWQSALEEWRHMGIVALEGPDSSLSPEPLRLALLAPDRSARDLLVDKLNHIGLGASRFYGTDLPTVAGIPEIVRRQGPFPNAASLAARLFTLPTHDLVTADNVKAACAGTLAWSRTAHSCD